MCSSTDDGNVVQRKTPSCDSVLGVQDALFVEVNVQLIEVCGGGVMRQSLCPITITRALEKSLTNTCFGSYWSIIRK